ncbi:hypothetical protein N7499_011561 [Penicillium canescens]|nr:hypothetical protein N7444_006568 [Penicillium canescens]KAJ6069674.1 hypothetical protein N7499_011561 [Penicillium canescens]KAJ6182274.1 hypothetical protein N7485_000916 [Penicillium canescens]
MYDLLPPSPWIHTDKTGRITIGIRLWYVHLLSNWYMYQLNSTDMMLAKLPRHITNTIHTESEDEDTFRPSDRRQGGPCERWRCYQQHLLPSLMLDRSIDRHDEKSETELGLRLDTEATEDDGGW